MAVAVALARGYLTEAVSNIWNVGFWRVAGIRPVDGMTWRRARARGCRTRYRSPLGLLVTLWLY